MLARSTVLRHPSGLRVDTPLLIPSFSSKGFGISARDGRSEIQAVLSAATEFLTDSMLISAYDLHHGHIPRIEAPITEITVVDSGGYETSDQQDLSSSYFRPVSPLAWSKPEYETVIGAWPDEVPAMLVSYDDGRERVSLPEQIENASELLSYGRQHLVTFLIRPETKVQRLVQVSNIVASIHELTPFSVIGLTEKELGTSMLDRMVNLARIRFAMDDAGISAPIHVFGCLDPISIPLYFLAGAEVFDGLSWLRYGFADGVAMYRHNSAAMYVGIDRHDDFVKVKTLQDNLGALVDLRNQMRRFTRDRDYEKFGRHAVMLRTAYELLATRERRVA